MALSIDTQALLNVLLTQLAKHESHPYSRSIDLAMQLPTIFGGFVTSLASELLSSAAGKGAELIGCLHPVTGLASTVSAVLTHLSNGVSAVEPRYHGQVTGAVPTQAQMVAAFDSVIDPAYDGKRGIFIDTTPGTEVVYDCVYSTIGGGWGYVALTLGA